MTLNSSQTESLSLVQYGWRRPDNWHFARDLSAVALTPYEIGIASHFFPIVFCRQIYGWRAFAVFCLDNGLNRFVHTVSGDWLAGYAPVFLRSAPFMLHTGTENALQFWPSLGPEPLSNELEPFLVNGKLNKKIIKILTELKSAHHIMKNIDDAVTKLESCGGLVKWVVEEAGEPNVKIMGNEVWVVRPGYLNDMEEDLLLTLHKQKALEWLYSHQQSLTNVRRLLMKIENDVQFNFLENNSNNSNSNAKNNFQVEKYLNDAFKDETFGD